MPDPIYNDPRGLKAIQGQLLPDEILEAAFKATSNEYGTGVLAITSRRMIWYDIPNRDWDVLCSYSYNTLMMGYIYLRTATRKNEGSVQIACGRLIEIRFPDVEGARQAYLLLVAHQP